MIRPAEPGRAPVACMIFMWIGQPFNYCDNCGAPYWKHLYEPPVSGRRVLFRVRQVRTSGTGVLSWAWEPVGSLITREKAEACRSKWQRAW